MTRILGITGPQENKWFFPDFAWKCTSSPLYVSALSLGGMAGGLEFPR